MKFTIEKIEENMNRIKKIKCNTRKIRKGVTLIELTVVIFIIGAILAVIAFNLNPGEIKDSTAKLQLKSDANKIPSYLEIYSNKYGTYPTEDQGLDALVHKPESGDIPGNYTPVVKTKSAISDPWGTPYVLKYGDSGDYKIITLGRDKKEGGDGVNADFNILNEDEYPEKYKAK